MFIYLFLGKHSQQFPENLGRLVINYFLPKLLVTYGNHVLTFSSWRGRFFQKGPWTKKKLAKKEDLRESGVDFGWRRGGFGQVSRQFWKPFVMENVWV